MKSRRYSIFLYFFLPAAIASLPSLAQGQAIITMVAGAGGFGCIPDPANKPANFSAYIGDGGPALQAKFCFLTLDASNPTQEEYIHPAIDSAGNIYIPESGQDRVRRISPDGQITTVAGTGVDGGPYFFGGDGGAASQALLLTPKSVAFDKAGNLYIVDQDNLRVRKVDVNGIITTIAGNGDSNFFAGEGNGGPALQAGLGSPGGIALDSTGNIYLSDTFNDQIRKITLEGKITAVTSGADQGYAGDGGPAVLALLDSPAGLAVDAAGSVYVADQNNNRIRKIATDGTISTFAGNGTPSFSGDGGLATQASLNYPSDVVFDAAGNLYIADERNNRVRKVTPDGMISTVAGTGGQGYGGDGGPPAAAILNRPSGLAFDKSGNLYIIDHYNYRVREIILNPNVLSASPSKLAFSATAGGPAPATQAFTLTNPGSGTVHFTITSNQPWLSATPPSGMVSAANPVTITVSADTRNLNPASYSGSLSITSPEALSGPQPVQVNLTVQPVLPQAPVFTAGSVANGASFARGAIAPGEIISIFGSNLGPATSAGPAIDPSTGRLATTVAGVTVLFNNLPGALFYVQQAQINVQVPYELASGSQGLPSLAQIVVTYQKASSTPVTVPMGAVSPAIFAANQGIGQAALLNQDNSYNSASNPAPRGSIVQIYLTGSGAANPPVATGELPQAPFSPPVAAVRVKIGGVAAQTTFIGLAPGLAGLLQIDAFVPTSVVPGPNVALEITVGSAVTQTGVTLAVQ